MRGTKRHPLADIDCDVQVKTYVNGECIELSDLAICTQKLIDAAEAFLPEFYLDDTAEQKQLRKALQHLYDMKCFD